MAEWKMLMLKGRNVTQAKEPLAGTGDLPGALWSTPWLRKPLGGGHLLCKHTHTPRADMEVCSLNRSAVGAQLWGQRSSSCQTGFHKAQEEVSAHPTHGRNWVVAKEGKRLDQDILVPRWKTQMN